MRSCDVFDCDRIHFGRGFCKKHYDRWRSNGDPLKSQRAMGTEVERFWAKVDLSGDCWEWLRKLDTTGYARFLRDDGLYVGAHRWAYEHLVGPIPDGLTIDHLCRNRGCVNPDHLEPVTSGQNVLRGDGVTARNARKTECVRGHAFDAANTRIRTGGGRACRACERSTR